MSPTGGVEKGTYGRMAVIRLKPNQDLVEALEAACRDHGIRHGLIRAAVGSVTDASFDLGADEDQARPARSFVEGPGLEIVSLAGDIHPDSEGRPRVELTGSVADQDGQVRGGRFRRGENPICITMELVVQEWIPDEAPRA
ncbi:MAG: DNA-binding protein [Kiloniellales bacterium]|nr:DNA-binding protein [Kiloniellales bacterium]